MAISDTVPEEFHELANTQAAYTRELLAKPNVNGVGIGKKFVGGEETDDLAVKVFVQTKLPVELLAADQFVPPTLDRFPTDVFQTGVIFAGGADVDILPRGRSTIDPRTLSGRVRPAMGGFSIGHTDVTAGTIATGCYDRAPFPGIPEHYYALSNNHVLAASNQAAIGDPIVQPGVHDGGTVPDDVIGKLARFVPIRFATGGGTDAGAANAPCNYADCAVAEIDFHDIDRRIFWIGQVRRINRAPTVGTLVQKTGRTTSYSTGRITDINADVTVNYGAGRVARFCRQIITTRMSEGGDSGSLLVDLDEGASGLLFAGSPSITIHNPITFVEELMGIRIAEI